MTTRTKLRAHHRARHASRLTVAGLGAGALLALAAPLAANAHVTVTPDGTAAGSTALLTFSTSHGCEGSPTTGIAIDIPAPIAAVTPTVNPNWSVETVVETLDEPVTDAHGATITEREASVRYTAKEPLADGLRDTFTVSLRIPDDAAGQTLYFPVTQTCVEGETSWSELPAEGGEEPEHPAPSITVTVADASDGEGHGAEAAAGHDADETAGNSAAAGAADAGGDDIVARVFGITGLVVGAIGVALALAAGRRPARVRDSDARASAPVVPTDSERSE